MGGATGGEAAGPASGWLAAASALGVAAIGAGGAFAWTRIAHGGPRGSTAAPRYFAADRDAGEVVALDEDFFVVRRFAVELPIEVETRRDGGLWVACASSAGPRGPHRLRRLEPDGRIASEIALGPVLDLETLDGGPALVVASQPTGAREALLVHSAGATLTVAAAGDLACIAGSGGRIAVGTCSGVVRVHDAAGGARIVERDLGGSLADLAPGPERDTWWALDAGGAARPRRVLVLESDLAVRWERPIGMLALHLAPVAGEERVWIVDSSAPLAGRLGPKGALEVPPVPLSLAGCERGIARRSAGAVFAAPGALLVVDAAGRSLPGQGGFDFLVDVAEARSR
jgi:hypothetical protein